jgi:hypothetical protein
VIHCQEEIAESVCSSQNIASQDVKEETQETASYANAVKSTKPALQQTTANIFGNQVKCSNWADDEEDKLSPIKIISVESSRDSSNPANKEDEKKYYAKNKYSMADSLFHRSPICSSMGDKEGPKKCTYEECYAVCTDENDETYKLHRVHVLSKDLCRHQTDMTSQFCTICTNVFIKPCPNGANCTHNKCSLRHWIFEDMSWAHEE